MPDIKQHEYALLDEIAQDSKVTQANLSARLGIAVGSVNWYIKRLIHRGWVKVSRLDRTRLKYDLTPEGMTVFTQRAILYARDSLKTYTSLRGKAKSLILDLKHQGVKSVYLDGDDELMDILRLTCMESGLLVVDAPKDIILRSSGQGYAVIRQSEG
ncbi:MAG: winged helix-turn-helix transcriptional regulator [Anaerolineales bacterium]